MSSQKKKATFALKRGRIKPREKKNYKENYKECAAMKSMLLRSVVMKKK